MRVGPMGALAICSKASRFLCSRNKTLLHLTSRTHAYNWRDCICVVEMLHACAVKVLVGLTLGVHKVLLFGRVFDCAPTCSASHSTERRMHAGIKLPSARVGWGGRGFWRWSLKFNFAPRLCGAEEAFSDLPASVCAARQFLDWLQLEFVVY